jgi:histidinol-phosphate aminotransferase
MSAENHKEPSMKPELSRRLFMGMTGVAALGATSAALKPAVAVAQSASTPKYGPAPGVAKLNANENPYGPSQAALTAMAEASAMGAYFVGDSVSRLKAMIGERFSLPPSQVSLSSGSSGVLTYFTLAKAKEGKILGTDLFWDTTTRAALRQGGELVRTAPTGDLGVDLDALYAAITPEVSMVQICNPNNPTGIALEPGKLRDFCIKASKKCTVLVDEAYNEITDDPAANTMVPLIREGHDVVVARTFSKIYGLAGMRVGYLLASEENTAKTANYSLGDYALNQAGVAAAVASFDDTAFLTFSKNRILEARQLIIDAATENGLRVAPSQTSFVYVDLGSLDAEAFRAAMAEQNVLIRGIYQDYTGWSRVSCGRLEHVQQYAAAMPRALETIGA